MSSSKSKNGCGCCEKWINYKTAMRYHRKCYENHTAASNFSCSVIWRKRNELEAALILSNHRDIVGHTNRDLNLFSGPDNMDNTQLELQDNNFNNDSTATEQYLLDPPEHNILMTQSQTVEHESDYTSINVPDLQELESTTPKSESSEDSVIAVQRDQQIELSGAVMKEWINNSGPIVRSQKQIRESEYINRLREEQRKSAIEFKRTFPDSLWNLRHFLSPEMIRAQYAPLLERYLSRVPNIKQTSESTIDSKFNSEESNLNLDTISDAEDIIADSTLHHNDYHDTEDKIDSEPLSQHSGIEINSPSLSKKRRRKAIERLNHELSMGGLRF